MSTHYQREFPCLEPLGLYAADIKGDGNCLFNALSDQLYGSQAKHYELRQSTIEYMRAHKEYFAMFMDVLPGGATRRNPKRKTAGGYTSTSFDSSAPTPAEINHAFDMHLERMSKGGTYGDNLEISAFSSCYEVDVQIFQREHSYMVTGEGKKEGRATLHIAYHTWEHYSSIRNIKGPHYGLPNVQMKNLTPELLQKQQENIRNAPQVIPGQLKALMASLYFPVVEAEAAQVLEQHHGNVNNAVDALIRQHDDKESLEDSSMQSSSVERDPGSDEDFRTAPKKKQDRRLSRASKLSRRRHQERKHHDIAKMLKKSNESLESLVKVKPATVRRRRLVVDSDDDDESISPPPAPNDESISPPPALNDGSTTPDSEYSQPTDYSSQSQTESMQPIASKISAAKAQFNKPRLPSKPLSTPAEALARYDNARPNGITKFHQNRLPPSRDRKGLQKQAQKQQAKGRRRQSASLRPKTASAATSFGGIQQSAAPVMSHFRVLHI